MREKNKDRNKCELNLKRKTEDKINKTRSCFFEKIKKIEKPQKRKKTQTANNSYPMTDLLFLEIGKLTFTQKSVHSCLQQHYS